MLSTSWNLAPLFRSASNPTIKATRQSVAKATRVFIAKWGNRTDYLSDPKILKEALDEYENWQRNYGPYDAEVYYFSLRTSQNQLDPKLKARFNQAVELATKLENEILFFTLSLAKIKPDDQDHFLNYPGLVNYRHFLERLFIEAKHLLSESEEKIINLKRQTSHSNWTKMVSTFISQEEREVVLEDGSRATKSFSDFHSLLLSRNKKVRDSAATAINDVLAKYAPIAEQEINSILANKKNDDELRHLHRPDSARHLSDDIDPSIVDALLKAVSEKFEISQRWYQLKAKLMGLPKLDYHDRVAEFGQVKQAFSYEESTRLVSSVFTKIDQEFGQIFDQFVSRGQIDVYPAKGKQGGAFCSAGSITLPTYILLNHTNKFNDVRTLAHEAGHGINDELMKKQQNALSFGSPLSTAEVASTFFEDFVLKEVISGANDEEKLTIMVKKVDDDVSTIFRQTACYLFEQELHEQFRKKGYLSKEEIGKLFQKHMASYMGPAVEQSPGSENWWVSWSHIRSFFYVYSYASGLLISKSLQAAVKEDPQFTTKVKGFLSAGSAKSPREIFNELGIDINDPKFWQRGISEIATLLEQTATLAKKLGQIS